MLKPKETRYWRNWISHKKTQWNEMLSYRLELPAHITTPARTPTIKAMMMFRFIELMDQQSLPQAIRFCGAECSYLVPIKTSNLGTGIMLYWSISLEVFRETTCGPEPGTMVCG